MTETFGRQLLAMTPAEITAAETAAGRTDELSPLLAAVAKQASSGKATVEVKDRPGPRGSGEILTVRGLSPGQREAMQARFDLGTQEASGAWYLPEDLKLRPGFANLVKLHADQPRFAVNLVRDEYANCKPRDNPDALFAWSVVIPFFNDVFAPIDLRTATGKLPPPDKQSEAWAGVDDLYTDLGLDVATVLDPMRYGNGWTRLRMDAQLVLRAAFIDQIRAQLSEETVRRWRARNVKALADAFYRKAKKTTPLARTFITKAHQPLIAGLFAGDWIGFLDYLGESPNDGEQITTVLPKERIFVADPDKTAAVAAAQGLPVDEVEKMVAAFLGEDAAAGSPVLQRTAVMRRWWDSIDVAYANQRSGMTPLWGVIDEGWIRVHDDGRTPSSERYRQFISAELCAEIDRLWDGVTLPRWPERIVSEFRPHRQMAEAFGPAASFWNSVALTCWYVCEGPYSRTDIPGLKGHQERELHDLAELGTPVDDSLFTDLIEASKRLGPVQEIKDETHHGSLTFSIVRGQRRDGFEILNEVVTRHRRAWAAQHLDAYLRARWDSELRAVAREYSRRTAGRGGKAPTLKQFAAVGAPAANHWFGGDLARLYAGVGEKAAVFPDRIDLLPGDPMTFVRDVYRNLGGGPPLSEDEWLTNSDARRRQQDLERFATQSTRYLQLWEALGRPPTAKEFGADRWDWSNLGGEDAGWARYEAAINQARTQGAPAATTTTASAPASSPVASTPAAEPVAPAAPAPPPPPPQPEVPANWYPDPAGRFEYRYWDGLRWTEHVSTQGQQSTDPPV